MKELGDKKTTEKNLVKEISIKLIVAGGLFILSLFLFGFIVDEVLFENEDIFDSRVASILSSGVTPGIIHFMKMITFFGSSTFLLPAYIILAGAYFLIGKKNYSINISVIALSSTALMFGLKNLFHRKRPPVSLIGSLKSYSFPSGHALSSFIFCSVLVYLIWKTKIKTYWKWIISILLLVFALSIGISRIVLGVHYASDVLAGFCLGLAWVIISFWLLRKLELRRGKAVSPD